MGFVTRIASSAALGAAVLSGAGLFAPPAQAGYIETLEQQGSNVVAKGSGAIDLAGLTFLPPPGIGITVLIPNAGTIGIGAQGPADIYAGFVGSTNFGNRGETAASSGSGNIVGIDDMGGLLDVPAGYVSGNRLSSTATWDKATFSSLGVTPGTYKWTWGRGANQNFTLDIKTTSVPEPSSLLVLGVPLGLVMLLVARRRRAAHNA